MWECDLKTALIEMANSRVHTWSAVVPSKLAFDVDDPGRKNRFGGETAKHGTHHRGRPRGKAGGPDKARWRLIERKMVSRRWITVW